MLCSLPSSVLIPLMVKTDPALGPSFTNPSIISDKNSGSVWVNLRNLNYLLYHSELSNFEHPWGPIIYLHPESEPVLRTINIIAKLNSDLTGIDWSSVVDTSKLDVQPMWEFHGLEDGRLVKWMDKLYLCGVRRDTTPNGVGRMELSEIQIDEANRRVSEVSRYRIPIPGPNPSASYCEKNWVPVVDRPYEFIKWSNPTEVVRTYPDDGRTETVSLGNPVSGLTSHDMRGGSQVIRLQTSKFGNVYLHIVHETDLYFTELGRKNATYTHRAVLRDPTTMEVVGISDPFTFMDGKVEFCCGLAQHPADDSRLLVTFGFQDNSAFMVNVSAEEVISLCRPVK